MQNSIIKNALILSLLIFSTNFTLSDAAEPWQFGFQDPATPIMEGIINFHNHIMFFFSSSWYYGYVVISTFSCTLRRKREP
jgi:hypothetical protein